MSKSKIVIVILVILLVLSVGLNLFLFNFIIEDTKESNCENQIDLFFDSELDELTNALENTANNFIETNIQFGKPPGPEKINSLSSYSYSEECGKYLKKEIIKKLDFIENSRQCATICNAPLDRCFDSIIYAPDIPNGYYQNCAQLPTYTSFRPIEDCELVDGYNIIDPLEEVPFGNYIFTNITGVGETYPKICTYYKPFE